MCDDRLRSTGDLRASRHGPDHAVARLADGAAAKPRGDRRSLEDVMPAARRLGRRAGRRARPGGPWTCAPDLDGPPPPRRFGASGVALAAPRGTGRPGW